MKTIEKRLSSLRFVIRNAEIVAYIIPNEDVHLENNTAPPDKRVQYITGCRGIVGDAVVTAGNALLWASPKYCTQISAAEMLASCWTLMEDGTDKSIEEWLCDNLEKGSKVGMDPQKISFEAWMKLSHILSGSGIELVYVEANLVDEIWIEKPNYPTEKLFIYDLHYAGETVGQKLQRLRSEMRLLKTDLFTSSTLDEIAWLTNLRAEKVDYRLAPVFSAFIIVGKHWASLYMKGESVTEEITKHLEDTFKFTDADYYIVETIVPNITLYNYWISKLFINTLIDNKVHNKAYTKEFKHMVVFFKEGNANIFYRIFPYQQFWSDIELKLRDAKKVLLPKGISCAIHTKIVARAQYVEAISPLVVMKSYKNGNEVLDSRSAHLRDAVAFCQLLYYLENEAESGSIDEMKAAEYLINVQSDQKRYKGPAFESHIAFGPNGSIPLYVPIKETNTLIDKTSLLIIEAGGQYLGGTTAVARVLHLGDPTDTDRKIYTCLIKGVANLATTLFPDGTKASSLSMIIRRPALQMGYCFEQDISHSVGAFLAGRERFNDVLRLHFIGAQGIAYYQTDEFGMKLTNVYVVLPSKVKSGDENLQLCEFVPLTLIPFENKLIDLSILDSSQIQWLNRYHHLVKKCVGKEMVKQKKDNLYKWLLTKTFPLEGGKKTKEGQIADFTTVTSQTKRTTSPESE